MVSAGVVNILPSTFLFMNNFSFLGRQGGLGWAGKKPTTPDIHNNNLLASHKACCYVLLHSLCP